jgi:hypothetical protein
MSWMMSNVVAHVDKKADRRRIRDLALESGVVALYDAFGASPNVSGVAINEASALTVLAVYRLRAHHQRSGRVPPVASRIAVSARGKERATDHAVYSCTIGRIPRCRR